jgi:O-acetyl-ADP-ribose deacetylase (regulator of RNase III)
MKQIRIGNILSVSRGIIVHGCNAQGVMGSGVAAQIRSLYPDVFDCYKSLIEAHDSPRECLGRVAFYTVTEEAGEPGNCAPRLIIANAITQEDFGSIKRKYVRYEAIATAFEEIVQVAKVNNLPIHYPLIGAGLGGGDWAIISDIISAIIPQSVDSYLWIYE